MINKNYKKKLLHYRKKNKYLKIFMFVLIIVITIAIILYVNMSPIIHKSIISHGNLAVQKIVNEKVNEVLDTNQNNIKSILEIKYTNENIKSISVDSILVNTVKNQVTRTLISCFETGKPYKYRIALNTLLGAEYIVPSNIFCNLYVNPFTSIDTKIDSEFVDAGINQTKIRITLKSICTVNLSVMNYSDTIIVENEFVLAEEIIIGDVPEFLTR